MKHGAIRVLLGVGGLIWVGTMLAGCGPPAVSEGGFDAPDPASRIYAIHRAGVQGDVQAIPRLIEQLDSDDPAVRMYAIEALQRITDQRLGYSPYANPAARAEAVERWVRAYEQGRLTSTNSGTIDEKDAS